MVGPKPFILFVINEDWFFKSHFLTWAEAGKRAGYEVAVLASRGTASAFIEERGIPVIASRASRGGLLPRGLVGAARQLAQLATGPRPTIVHAFGLHGMAITGLAQLLFGRKPTAISVTGLGFLGAEQHEFRRLTVAAMTRVIPAMLDSPSTWWLTENANDARLLGLDRALAAGRVVQLGGAGVDVEAFSPAPLPAAAPLRLILVARMIRSKGVDLAVEAVILARRRGLDVTLTLVGGRDPDNPRTLTEAELSAFGALEGITVLGPREDVALLLGQHHAFILPSRGGEGLPKALIEAAAVGRPAIVTNVPGCSDFVLPGKTGYVVEPSVDELARAIASLAASDIAAMSSAARERCVEISSSERVSSAVLDVYLRLLAAEKPIAVHGGF